MSVLTRAAIIGVFGGIIFTLMSFFPPLPQSLLDMIEMLFSKLHIIDVFFPTGEMIQLLSWVILVEIGLLATKLIATVKNYVSD